ncbi:PTS system lactose-specific IIA component [Lactobacillus colini]|uniref:PTS system lactose-specific EIIA component n=1 Tax=Lactobacillus colini TaxID=1819254 RepID=A0ABS4ME13_9LACO|nr:PTS lactose/cellobiose transporter subunit IIA [Lactobacillus colini]MBP2057586.1 PTS system lactose-specific IIA component [Lactobacillus colini]
MNDKNLKEKISMVGFDIVAYAGDARSYLLDALNKARIGNITEAKKLISEAEESINEAHKVQTNLMSEEAGGSNLDMTFIMAHGQDTLMTTMLLKDEMTTIIDLYERINILEGREIR